MENKNKNDVNATEIVGVTETTEEYKQELGLLQEDLNQAIKNGDEEEIEFCEKEIAELEIPEKIRQIKAETKNVVFVQRVAYGKADTKEEDREYQIDGKGPVGTIQEFIDAGFTPVIEEKTERCKETCRVSNLTDEKFICGETKLNGKTWLCDDCLEESK